MSPIEYCWFGNPGTVIRSPRNPTLSSVLLRSVFHGPLDRHVHLVPVALAHFVLGRHPLVQPDHQHVESDPDRDQGHAAHERFAKQNARIAT